MRPPDIIVYVANRQVNRPIRVITCTNGYCSLVATENDWAENRAMRLRMIFRDGVLESGYFQFTSLSQRKRLTAWFQAHNPDMKF